MQVSASRVGCNRLPNVILYGPAVSPGRTVRSPGCVHWKGRGTRQGAIGLVIDRDYLEIGFPLDLSIYKLSWRGTLALRSAVSALNMAITSNLSHRDVDNITRQKTQGKDESETPG